MGKQAVVDQAEVYREEYRARRLLNHRFQVKKIRYLARSRLLVRGDRSAVPSRWCGRGYTAHSSLILHNVVQHPTAAC